MSAIPSGVLVPTYTSSSYGFSLSNVFASMLLDSSSAFQISIGPSYTANSNVCYSMSGSYGYWASSNAWGSNFANLDYGTIAAVDIPKGDYSNIIIDFLNLVSASNAGTLVF